MFVTLSSADTSLVLVSRLPRGSYSNASVRLAVAESEIWVFPSVGRFR